MFSRRKTQKQTEFGGAIGGFAALFLTGPGKGTIYGNPGTSDLFFE
jgi:hypothetical protein